MLNRLLLDVAQTNGEAPEAARSVCTGTIEDYRHWLKCHVTGQATV